MTPSPRSILESTPGAVLAIVAADGTPHTYSQRGIADLFELLHREPALLRGASVADKVVGKGAAALMAIGGVAEVWAGVMSIPAMELLQNAGVKATCDILTEGIQNRAGTGRCPVETLCESAATPQECFPLITEFINRIKKENR